MLPSFYLIINTHSWKKLGNGINVIIIILKVFRFTTTTGRNIVPPFYLEGYIFTRLSRADPDPLASWSQQCGASYPYPLHFLRIQYYAHHQKDCCILDNCLKLIRSSISPDCICTVFESFALTF